MGIVQLIDSENKTIWEGLRLQTALEQEKSYVTKAEEQKFSGLQDSPN